MSVSRVERKAKERAQRRSAARLVAVLSAALVIGAVGLWASHARDASPWSSTSAAGGGSARSAPGATVRDGESSTVSTEGVGQEGEDFLTYAPIPASTDTTLVEVPNIVGRSLSDARALLEAADLRASGSGTSGDPATRVLSQQPAAGNIVTAGSEVAVGVAAVAGRPGGRPVAGKVVVLDPGHQSHSDTVGEPIGPGSTQLKARVTGGATGIGTRVPEYEIALEIAMNVRSRLMREGVKVVMTRTTNDVDISNVERARKANEAGAALFVRIHADGSTDERVSGIHTLYPAVTQWTRSTSAPSERAARLVQSAVIISTLAKSVGVSARSDLAGFNWCTKPSILIECGFLSNSIEDRLLTSPGYQDKVASGITRGILEYLGS